MKSLPEIIANQAYFKTELVRTRFSLMHPKAQVIAVDAFNHALEIGVEHPVFTETVTTIEEDLRVARQHDQHRRRVAFDFRVIDWSGEQIDAMAAYLNEKYKDVAYINGSGEKVIAFYHDNGHGPHFHVAINAIYKLKEYEG